MRKLFIVNPSALRDRTAATVDEIKAAFGEEICVKLTEKGGDAMDFARTADADEVYAVGGDGTVWEVVNGLGQRHEENKPLPTLGVIPSGSGNDFARLFIFSF